MHVNKVHHVTTIVRVAEDLGEDEDWLRDVANEMEVEDGVIWVYGVGEDGVQAFTDFGIENLIELVRIHKDTPIISKNAAKRSCDISRRPKRPTKSNRHNSASASRAKFTSHSFGFPQPLGTRPNTLEHFYA